MVGKVLAGPGALVHLRLGLDDRLAHLERHQARVVGLALLEHLGRVAQMPRPHVERSRSPFEERRVGGRQDALHLPDRSCLERFDDLAGRWIHRLHAHRSASTFLTPSMKAPTIGSE